MQGPSSQPPVWNRDFTHDPVDRQVEALESIATELRKLRSEVSWLQVLATGVAVYLVAERLIAAAG